VPDVAIVGAGPVGMVAALELIRRGIDVTLLERRSEPRDSSRSIGIHPPALRVLEGLGCADAVIDAGVPVREGEVRCDGAVLGTLSFRSASSRHPFILSVPQHVTERILRARLAEIAPGALVTGCEVTGAEQSADSVRLDTAHGSVRARWVIGADGPRSAMRTLGRFDVRRRTYPDRYVMGDAIDDAGLGDRAMLFLERDGVVESFPLPGGARRWVVHRGADPTPVDGPALAALVRRRTGVRLAADDIDSTSTFGVRHVWAESAVRGRVVLAGDAAHEISPIGGQGMTLGWLDAAELAAALADELRCRSGERSADGRGGARGAGGALRAYEATAARRQRMTARQAFFNTAMGRPRRGGALAVRNALVRSIAHPTFERRLAAAFTMAAPAATVRAASISGRASTDAQMKL